MNQQQQIRDYLNTQGLRLPADDVAMAMVVSAAVLEHAQVNDLPDVVRQEAPFLPRDAAHDALRGSLFAVLDSAAERLPAQATLYVKAAADEANADTAQPLLQCLSRTPSASLPVQLNADEHGDWLLYRAAQTGWAQIIDDAEYWHNTGEIGEHERNWGWSQLLLPLCAPSGGVMGVLHLASPEARAFDAAAQALWVGTALAVAQALYDFFPSERWGFEEENDIPTGN